MDGWTPFRFTPTLVHFTGPCGIKNVKHDETVVILRTETHQDLHRLSVTVSENPSSLSVTDCDQPIESLCDNLWCSLEAIDLHLSRSLKALDRSMTVPDSLYKLLSCRLRSDTIEIYSLTFDPCLSQSVMSWYYGNALDDPWPCLWWSLKVLRFRLPWFATVFRRLLPPPVGISGGLLMEMHSVTFDLVCHAPWEGV